MLSFQLHSTTGQITMDFFYLSNLILQSTDEEKIKFSNKYIEYLYENIGNYPFGAEKMAEHFGITSQYLRRQFRKETDSP